MTDQPRQRYDITKYPNRRFYDAANRRHVTLGDLHDIVRAGHDIRVTDKTTGRDITNVVLTQIILEHDPPKMDLFPASLLHQAIQMNESMARRFIDQYLAQAMDAFTRSRQQFESLLRQAGLPAIPQVTPPMDWLRMIMPGMTPPTSKQSPSQPEDSDATHANAADENDPAVPTPTDARDQQIEALQRQIAELGEQFARLQDTDTPPPRPNKKKKVAKKKKKTRKK